MLSQSHVWRQPALPPELAKRRGLYSTCASPVVPHLSTRHAHGCLASEIGRDPAFPTRYDRTESSSEDAIPSMLLRPEVQEQELMLVQAHTWIGRRHNIAEYCCVRWRRPHRSYNQGLISADRSNKATLLLTIPRCLLSRLQRISRAQYVKLPCNDKAYPLRAGPTHNMVQAEAIDTRVIRQPFSFLAWILF